MGVPAFGSVPPRLVIITIITIITTPEGDMSTKQTKGTTRRQRVGQEAKVEGSGTQAAKGSEEQPSAEARAEQKQSESTDPITYITARDTSSFQLRAGRDLPDGTSEPEWSIDFENGLAEATPEVLEAVEQVLAGTWQDRRVPGRVFATNARMVGLGIKKFGLEAPPFPTFDTLQEEQVMPVALASGVLGTEDAIKRAIRYEKQSGDRQPSRAVRTNLVKQLEAQLAVVTSQDAAPTSVPVVNDGTGGNIVGTAGVSTVPGLGLGASELG